MQIIAKLPGVDELKVELGLCEELRARKAGFDAEIARIIRGCCERLLLIVGPCSADEPAAVLEYAAVLAQIAQQVRGRIVVVLRAFTAKPRTATAGYMGLVHGPDGIAAARRLHLAVLSAGLPTADELLYTAILPYFDDVVSYFTIGARSVENQEHRLVASGLAVPVGMKNPISGDLAAMTNAVAAAKMPQELIFGGQYMRTTGNPFAHGILRGGPIPNYDADSLMALHNEGHAAIIVDTNHANSAKNYRRQPAIAMSVLAARRENAAIKSLVKGLMVESYIREGAAPQGTQQWGQSITDPCLGLAATEKLIYGIAEAL